MVMRPPHHGPGHGRPHLGALSEGERQRHMPKIMAAVVMMIGRSLVRPAVMSASRRSRPRPRRTFVSPPAEWRSWSPGP